MTLENKSIGVIGCGNMGAAIVEHLRKKNPGLRFYVLDKDQEKESGLVKKFQAQAADSIKALGVASDVVIIAVKPQDIEPVLLELKSVSGKLFISIAAGITLASLESALGNKASIIRAMPNLNALVGRSATALSPNGSVRDQDIHVAQEIFRAVGEVVTVPESQMNAVTAISGSGPAFVAYLKGFDENIIEGVFVREAQRFGIAYETAVILANATISGTRQMLATNLQPEDLIRRVSSKGGTTEAGMKVLQEMGKTEEALVFAVLAAKKRAEELSRRV
jgi:pyrroline-5-carboxylate reductase